MASPDFAANLAGWVNVLTEMESTLLAAARLNTGAEASGWRAPLDLGAMPPELLERAQRILTAQQAVIPQLEEAKRVAGRHLTAVRSVHQARPEHAVYLDVTG